MECITIADTLEHVSGITQIKDNSSHVIKERSNRHTSKKKENLKQE